MERFIVPNDVPICALDCRQAFQGLTVQEKRYAHHIARASWLGRRIVFIQTSHESPLLFVLFQVVFGGDDFHEYKRKAMESGVSEEDWKAFLVFVAAFYSNGGNYLSFGNTKILPGLAKKELEKCIRASQAYPKHRARIDTILQYVLPRVYDTDETTLQLALDEQEGKSCTTYYSDNCTKQDAADVQLVLDEHNISAYNTRLRKTGSREYEILIASSNKLPTTQLEGTNGVKLELVYGDYHELMDGVVKELKNAITYAVKDSPQAPMLEMYIKSFTEGSIDAHKEASKHWIKDKGPVVESYIGFIESYRDPYGVRGEWEGFVAVVNKEVSKKFNALVDRAESLLAKLPWPKAFEKDEFSRPDFTSLDVVAFAGSGVPAGINIPNYNDIRDNLGFKNVSLGNVLAAAYGSTIDENVTFLVESDQQLYKALVQKAFEVQVGLHELLGHGSGKLFTRDEQGKVNFDPDLICPVTSKHVAMELPLYNKSETWESNFAATSASYEECRAECVGIFLSTEKSALEIFNYETDSEQRDIVYINWLHMARAGILGLEYYSPGKGWGQAHMQARFGILQVMLEASEGNDFVKISSVENTSDGKPDIRIEMDESKIETIGKPAIGNFLLKLQVYKSTSNVQAGRDMYLKYTTPSPHFLQLREIVIARRKPRKLMVQPNTVLHENGECEVELKTYEPTLEGIIQSNLERHSTTWDEQILRSLWHDIDF